MKQYLSVLGSISFALLILLPSSPALLHAASDEKPSDSSNLTPMTEDEMAKIDGQDGFKFELDFRQLEIGAIELKDSDNFGAIEFTDLLINRYGEEDLNVDVDKSDALVFKFPSTKGLSLDIGTGETQLGNNEPGPSFATYGLDLAGTTLKVEPD
ncbi:MAG: DUF6160 family protein [bacterium]